MNAQESRLLVAQALESFRPAQPVFEPAERPSAVTVVCLLGFAGCAISAIMVLALAPNALVLLIGLALVGVQTACLSGLWRMRAWSVPAYVTLTVLVQLLVALGGGFSLLGLLLPAATIVVGLMNLDDME